MIRGLSLLLVAGALASVPARGQDAGVAIDDDAGPANGGPVRDAGVGRSLPAAVEPAPTDTPTRAPYRRDPSGAEHARALDAEGLVVDTGRIRQIKVSVDRPKPGEERQLEVYLLHLLGSPATEATARDAEEWLLRLSRYRAAVCRLGGAGPVRRMRCGVTRAPTIRRVDVDGLPSTFLETEFRRRVFLRPGEVLDQKDQSGQNRIARQAERLERYLEKKGLHGAIVRIVSPPVSRTSDVDVVIRVIGGEVQRVRSVKVRRHLPLDRATVVSTFSEMCTWDGLLNAFELGVADCYARERTREVVAGLEQRLRADGYPEARVSVGVTPVPPEGAEEERCRVPPERAPLYEKRREELPARCVDLSVDIRPGPHLVTSIRRQGERLEPAHQRELVPFFSPWLRPIEDLSESLALATRGFIETPSRALQEALGTEVATANDSDIVIAELEKYLTFSRTGSADEGEAQVSARALELALARRGYFDARVSYERKVRGERVDVDFVIEPGPVVAVHELTLTGNRAFSRAAILSAVEFATQPRSLTWPGFITPKDLEDDRVRLQRFYERNGFVEARVTADAMRDQRGRLSVHFRIHEGPQWTVTSLVIEGGDPALTPEVLSRLAHCAGGVAAKEKRKPVAPTDCVGTPFRPFDDEAYEMDRQRALNVYVANGYPYASVRFAPDPMTFSENSVGLRLEIDLLGGARPDSLARKRYEKDAEKNDTGAGGATGPAHATRPQRVRQGEIFLDGNNVTRRDVMLRELDVTSRYLKPTEIAQGVSRLRRTGLFSRVAADYIGIEEQADRVHLRLQVEERPSRLIDTSLGASTDRLFVLHVEGRDRNLYGSMLDLSASVDWGLFIGRYSAVSAQLRWPRILGYPIDARSTPAITFEDRRGVAIPRTPPAGGPTKLVGTWDADDFRRRTFRVAWSNALEVKPLPNNDALLLALSWDLRLDWDDPTGEPFGPFDAERYTSIDGWIPTIRQPVVPLSAFTPRITWRTLDNPFDPREGLIADASLMLGHPVPAVGLDQLGTFIGEFVGLATVQATGYTSFGPVTFAGNLRGWYGFAYRVDDTFERSALVRDQALLALGGDRSVRAYQQDQIGVAQLARDAKEGRPVFGANDTLTLGGVQANVEVRATVVPNLFVGDLKVASFIDLGLVTDDFGAPWLSPLALWRDLGRANANHPTERIGVSGGVGLRYVLPVGPLSADLALSPAPAFDVLAGLEPRPLPWRVHVQLGYVF